MTGPRISSSGTGRMMGITTGRDDRGRRNRGGPRVCSGMDDRRPSLWLGLGGLPLGLALALVGVDHLLAVILHVFLGLLHLSLVDRSGLGAVATPAARHEQDGGGHGRA